MFAYVNILKGISTFTNYVFELIYYNSEASQNKNSEVISTYLFYRLKQWVGDIDHVFFVFR